MSKKRYAVYTLYVMRLAHLALCFLSAWVTYEAMTNPNVLALSPPSIAGLGVVIAVIGCGLLAIGEMVWGKREVHHDKR